VQHRWLGPSGVLVSELALGTMTFGEESDEAECHRMLDAYVHAGGNLLDTADVYGGGAAEEIVGRWLAKRADGDELVVASKANFPMGDDPNRRGLSRRWLQRAVDDSLRRLQVDCLDLYQAHCWDPATPLEETLATFDDLVTAGKIRYVGVSNFTGWQLQRAVLTARHAGRAPVATLQAQYNLLDRAIEWELTPLCVDEGLGLLPWSPLGGGWLTGKYRRDRPPPEATRLGEDPERGLESWERRDTERTWQVVDALDEIAAEVGTNPAQMALRWVTDRPAVCSTVLGARTAEQLRDNLGAADVALSDEQHTRLDEVSDPGTPAYPYGLIRDATADR
jgi:aryl-alcohol dehydrogenase-like predicted oxidoreductase